MRLNEQSGLTKGSALFDLVAAATGTDRAAHVLSVLGINSRLAGKAALISRAQVAMALNVALFADLLDRVPAAAAYVGTVAATGARVCFDHGALRTIDGPSGGLPNGYLAFARILEPLGYTMAGVYPLPRLRMTGRAFAHKDMPEAIPQFFVSELHMAELPAEAQKAGAHIFQTSRDPLSNIDFMALDRLARDGNCTLELALAALPGLVQAFGRQHDTPALADYEALLAQSAEGAWISTEGNAFNHATDRVPNVDALAAQLKERGMSMKPAVEVSANGRVRQTAFRADVVEREFLLPDGRSVIRTVPGSFYEFISRDPEPETKRLDLTFDSGNATGIFAMTSAK